MRGQPTLKPADRRKLQVLHRKVIAGERARVDRDDLIINLFQQGVTQTEMALVLDQIAEQEEWDVVTRNRVQKIVQRQRSLVNG